MAQFSNIAVKTKIFGTEYRFILSSEGDWVVRTFTRWVTLDQVCYTVQQAQRQLICQLLQE